MYEIQHYTLCDGWVNTWLDHSDNPIQFKTRREAERELSYFLDDVQDAYLNGEIDSPYDPDDYRIIQIDNAHVHPIMREALPW